MYTHKKEQYTVYTTKCLVLSITDNLLSLCPANTWIPCSRCLVPAAVPTLGEAVQKLPRPTAQLRRSEPQARRLPPLCSGGDHEASVSQDGSPMSLQEWGCALRSPDQRCAALRAQGHTAQGKLCLITSHPNNMKLHCTAFSCLVLFGLSDLCTHLFDRFMALMTMPATQGKKTPCKWSSEALQKRKRNHTEIFTGLDMRPIDK